MLLSEDISLVRSDVIPPRNRSGATTCTFNSRPAKTNEEQLPSLPAPCCAPYSFFSQVSRLWVQNPRALGKNGQCLDIIPKTEKWKFSSVLKVIELVMSL